MRIETIEPEVETALKITGAVLLEGKAGSGKTSLLEYLAQKNGWNKVFYQVHPKTSSEELLYQMLPDEESPSGITLVPGVLVQALQKATEKPTLLILDEWDKSRPSLDAFVLDFLQNRRISVPNFEVELPKEKWDNLMIGFTSNGERELSEPFLRRVAVFRTSPLHPKDVLELLSVKHRDNPYLVSAVKLYVLTHYLDLPKPATIQELDQLLTAIELTPNADWNSLVYTYVTKTPETHELLAQHESSLRDRFEEIVKEVWGRSSEIPFVQPSAYSATEEDVRVMEVSQEEEVETELRLPRPFRLKPKAEEEEERNVEVEEESTFVVEVGEAEQYDALVSTLFDDDPEQFTQVGKFVVSKKTFSLDDLETMSSIQNLTEKLNDRAEGEILLTLDCSGLSKDEMFRLLREEGYKLGKLTKQEAVFVIPMRKDDGEDYLAEVLIKDYDGPSPSMEAILRLHRDVLEGFVRVTQNLVQERELRKKRKETLGKVLVVNVKKNRVLEILEDNPLVEIADDRTRREVSNVLREFPFEKETGRIREGIEFTVDFVFKNEVYLAEEAKELLDRVNEEQELFFRGLMSLFGPHFLIPASTTFMPTSEYESLKGRTRYPYLSAIDSITKGKKAGSREKSLYFYLAYLAWTSHVLSTEVTPVSRNLWETLSPRGRDMFCLIPKVLSDLYLPRAFLLPPGYLKDGPGGVSSIKDPFGASLRGVAYPLVNHVISYTGKENVKMGVYEQEKYGWELLRGEDRINSEVLKYANKISVGRLKEKKQSLQLEFPPVFICVPTRSYHPHDEKGAIYVVSTSLLGPAGEHLKGVKDGWEKFLELLSDYVEGQPRSIGYVSGEQVIKTKSSTKLFSATEEAGKKVAEALKELKDDADFVRALEFGNTVFLTRFLAKTLSCEHLIEGVRFKLPEELKGYYTKDFFNDLGDLISVEKGREKSREVAVAR